MPDNKHTLLCCDIVVPEEVVEILWGLLALHVNFGWEEESLSNGDTRFRVYCENEEFMENLTKAIRFAIPHANIDSSHVKNQDWTLAWREYFTPITCGEHFIVLPPWLVNSTDLHGRKSIIIEPKSAFGTGHHSTTALCLKAISQLLEQGRLKKGMEFLDLGTGSGILGIGCCKYELYGIGTDIDMLAVDNAKENKLLNNICNYTPDTKEGFDVILGSVETVAGRQFDVVIANILARPLKELAADIVALLKNDGCLILSGLLSIQAPDVQEYYTQLGLPTPTQITDGEWCALTWN